MTDQELQDKQALLAQGETEIANLVAKQRDLILVAQTANAEGRGLRLQQSQLEKGLTPLRDALAAEVGARKAKAREEAAAKVVKEKTELEQARARIAELEAEKAAKDKP